jgi:hypothetical protein
MKGRRALALAFLALVLQALLAGGALAAWPALLRVVLAGAVLVLAPGAAWLALLRAPMPGGAWLTPGWALGLGVAWNALLVVATRVAHVPFTVLSTATMASTALLWALVIARRGAAPHAPPNGTGLRGEPAVLAGVPLVLTLLAAAAAAVYAARFGAPLTSISDSPDHIGTIRRMLEHGDAFPTDAFFKNAGPSGVDPRKFLWHAQAALITRLAGVDPVVGWRDLPALLSPLLVLNVAALGMLLAGPAGAATAAWAALFTYGGSLAATPMRETVFSAKLADQLALAASVAMLADLMRPSRGGRLAAVSLAFGAVATHVFAIAQLALVLTALGGALILRDRGLGSEVRRLAGTALAMLLAALPLALWQVLRTPHSHNLIHTESQGLLILWDHVRVVSPGVLWSWMGPAWLLFPLLAPPLWREGRGNPAVLWLLATAIAVAVTLFVPPVVALLEPRLGYLLMRVVWITPLAGLVGWALPHLWRTVRDARGAPRLRAAGLLALTLVLLAPAVADALQVARHAKALAAEERAHSPLPWSDALRWMDRSLPRGQVVLSDPVTSYSVPMFTGHYVATLVDQHSSPSDSLALTRLLDARDALDPFAEWTRTREVIRRYGVGVIVLNDRFAEVPVLDYWTPRPEWFREARARFDRHPRAFERVFDTGDFVVYRVNAAALDTLRGPATRRSFTEPYRPGESGVGRRVGPGVPALLSTSVTPRVAAPLDTLRGAIAWRALERLPAGSYQVAVRFDRPLPGGLIPPAIVGKPVRKLIEKLRHERYRFRSDHLPGGGDYGVDLWRPDQVVRDSFTLEIPGDVADGAYQIRVIMLRQPHYANFRLSDYFFDNDYYAGLPVGTVLVRRGGDEATRPQREGGTRTQESGHVRH